MHHSIHGTYPRPPPDHRLMYEMPPSGFVPDDRWQQYDYGWGSWTVKESLPMRRPCEAQIKEILPEFQDFEVLDYGTCSFRPKVPRMRTQFNHFVRDPSQDDNQEWHRYQDRNIIGNDWNKPWVRYYGKTNSGHDCQAYCEADSANCGAWVWNKQNAEAGTQTVRDCWGMPESERRPKSWFGFVTGVRK